MTSMADVTLVHFLKGYLEGRMRHRQEQEEQRRLEQQQSVVLAQFLEAIKQRELEEKYKAFQMEMSKRQMELSERQQAFMERHYTIMQEIQKAELQIRQEESADRRQMLALQTQGYLLNLLGDTVQMFGDPKRSIEFLQKNPNPTISDWAKGLNPNDTRLIAKAKSFEKVKSIVANWRDTKPPSKKLVADIIRTNGLQGIYTEDEIMSLFVVQAQSNEAEVRTRKELMSFQNQLDMRKMAFGASLEAKMKALQQAQTEAQKEAMRKKVLFDIVNDVTLIHKSLTADVVPKPEDLKKALLDIDAKVGKAMMDLGVDPQVSTFYTLSGLYTLAFTKKNVPLQVMHLLNEYTSNEAMRRSWLRGAEALASEALGRPAKEEEVYRFVLNYGTKITGSKEAAKSMWWQMTKGKEPTVMKSAK